MVVTRSSKRKPDLPARKPVKTSSISKRVTRKAKGSANSKPGSASNAEATPTPTAPDGCSYYLFKSEPESRIQNGHEMKFSIDDLAAEKDATTHWDGVRNAEAKNTMFAMKKGDMGFFYHSNTKKSRPGIVGVVEVVREAYPDHTAFDKKDPHYDPKSSPDSPRWYMVDIRLVRKFPRCVTLDEVKANKDLAEMQLVKRGRISVQRVTKEHWDVVETLSEKEGPVRAGKNRRK